MYNNSSVGPVMDDACRKRVKDSPIQKSVTKNIMESNLRNITAQTDPVSIETTIPLFHSLDRTLRLGQFGLRSLSRTFLPVVAAKEEEQAQQ